MNLLSIDTKVSTKINKMLEIINELEFSDLPIRDELENIYLSINSIYLNNLLPIIEEYKREEKHTRETQDKFNLCYSNVINVYNINALFCEFKEKTKTIMDFPNLAIIISEYQNINASFNFHEKRENICCDVAMDMNDIKSHYVCKICGLCKIIEDSVYDEKYIYSLGPNYSKTVHYQHTRTLDEWLNNILCKVDFELKSEERIKIEFELSNKKFSTNGNAKKLTIEIIRKILRKTNLIQYNNKAAKILSIYTGIEPPLISGEDVSFIKNIYYDIINLSETTPQIKRNMPERNKPYCPFFIYKIIQTHWANDREKSQIKKLIHMQNDETTKKMDLVWFEYCKIRGLTFKCVNFTEKRNFE